MANKIVRAIFDNNAWNDIVVRNPTSKLLLRLQRSVVQGSVLLFVTPGLIEETLAFAKTNADETRRRLGYLRAFGHGHVLLAPGEIIALEARGEPTDSKVFMTQEDESLLFASVLDACDNKGTFISPVDGNTYHAATLVGEAKTAARDSARSMEKKAEDGILALWDRDSSGDSQGSNDLGLPPKATPQEVLQAWGKVLIQRAPLMFESWVAEFLGNMGAPAAVIKAGLAAHPFASAYVAYWYAHASRHFKNGTLWAIGDSYDRQYCVLSVAGDVLVTSDVNLQRTCQLMPFRPFQVLSAQEFIEKYA